MRSVTRYRATWYSTRDAAAEFVFPPFPYFGRGGSAEELFGQQVFFLSAVVDAENESEVWQKIAVYFPDLQQLSCTAKADDWWPRDDEFDPKSRALAGFLTVADCKKLDQIASATGKTLTEVVQDAIRAYSPAVVEQGEAVVEQARRDREESDMRCPHCGQVMERGGEGGFESGDRREPGNAWYRCPECGLLEAHWSRRAFQFVYRVGHDDEEEEVRLTAQEKRQYLLGALQRSKEYREQYVEANIGNSIAFQVRAMRDARGWTQSELGTRVGKQQEVISQLEDPNYCNYTLRTLKRLASAFDVALVVRFEPFSRLVDYVTRRTPADLAVPEFDADFSAPCTGFVGATTTLSYEPIPDGEIVSVLEAALHDLTAPQHLQDYETVARLRTVLRRLKGEPRTR